MPSPRVCAVGMGTRTFPDQLPLCRAQGAHAGSPPLLLPLFETQSRGPGAASPLLHPGLVLMSWAKASQALVPGKLVPPGSARPEP